LTTQVNKETNLITIPIDSIKFHPDSIRTHLVTDENVIDLANAIEIQGLLNVSTVTNRDDYYILTDGARRFTAIKLLRSQGKWGNDIPVKLERDLTDDQIIGMQISGNYNIKKTANKQYINGLFKIAISGKKTATEVAKMAGITVEYMMKLFKALKLPTDVFALCEKEQVSIGNLITISELSSKIELEDWPDWVQKAKTMTQKELNLVVAEELTEIRNSANAKRTGKKTEFIPEPILLKKTQLLENFIKSEKDFHDSPTRDNEVVFSVYQSIFQMDAENVILRRTAWEKEQEAKRLAAEKRKTARLITNNETMIKSLTDLGYKVEKTNG